MIAPGLEHWVSQDEGFPWNLFAGMMGEPGFLQTQMEDGMEFDPDKVDWRAFSRDPRKIIYLFALDSQVAGYTLLQGKGVACVEFHMGFLPWARGRLAKGLGLWTLGQLFASTSCHKVRTEVPRFNKAACRMATELGMCREGLIHETFRYRGVMWDTLMYGVTRDEFLVRFKPEGPNNGAGAVHHH